MPIKIWSLKKSDEKFSLWIRNRDKKCLRCGRTLNLQCSHFWGRGRHNTRYDPENCITLCGGCHYFKWEREKQGEYRDFMINWLGQARYDALEIRAYQFKKKRDAILELMEWLK